MQFSLTRRGLPESSDVFDTYWYFSCERQRMYFRRLAGHLVTTSDPILAQHRFTNAYRVVDRVSQYLITNVIPGSNRTAEDVFFRTLLFKIFNKIETWELIVQTVGEPHWGDVRLAHIEAALASAKAGGAAIYSAAYIMPSPARGGPSKAGNHLRLLEFMLKQELHKRWLECTSLRDVYGMLLQVPSLGTFLALQFAIDLGYSDVMPADESAFVIAGPGARSGIAKCFPGSDRSPEDIIMAVTEAQEREFSRRGLDFLKLWGRPLQPIDCQNLFCEVDKYARVAHPEVAGSGRTKIKQSYRPLGRHVALPTFPVSWKVQSTPAVAVEPAFGLVS